MKILENILITALTVIVIGFLFGVIESPYRGETPDHNDISQSKLAQDHPYDLQGKIDAILGASGGRFRVFSKGNRIILIDTATSRIALLDPDKEAWMNLQLGERTLTGFESEKLILFLEGFEF